MELFSPTAKLGFGYQALVTPDKLTLASLLLRSSMLKTFIMLINATISIIAFMFTAFPSSEWIFIRLRKPQP